MKTVCEIDAENFIKIDTPVTLDVDGVYPEYKRRKDVITFEKTERPVQEGDAVLLVQQSQGEWVYTIIKVPHTRYAIEVIDGEIYCITDTLTGRTVSDDVHANRPGWEDALTKLKAKCDSLNLVACG